MEIYRNQFSTLLELEVLLLEIKRLKPGWKLRIERGESVGKPNRIVGLISKEDNIQIQVTIHSGICDFTIRTEMTLTKYMNFKIKMDRMIEQLQGVNCQDEKLISLAKDIGFSKEDIEFLFKKSVNR